jgi:hypothetical protein
LNTQWDIDVRFLSTAARTLGRRSGDSANAAQNAGAAADGRIAPSRSLMLGEQSRRVRPRVVFGGIGEAQEIR